MSTASNKKAIAAFVFLFLQAAVAAWAQDRSAMPWLNVEFPRDSPVSVVSFSLGDSTASVRGISLALALHTSITLRNAGTKPIHGLTLLVQAQDLTPAGKASVTVPSLNVLPGEIFPVRLDLELLRPFNTNKNGGALVEVTLDCVLFDDLSAYGPDLVHSRRSLAVFEWEARRDRQYFRQLLANGEYARLQQELNYGLPESRPPQLVFEILNDLYRGETLSHPVPVSLIPFRDSPVRLLNGEARVYRNEVQAPQIELQNRTERTLQSIDVGWILRDNSGRSYLAGSLPTRVQVGPVQQQKVLESGVLRFSHPSGRPMLVDGVMAFISSVQFGNGELWIPSRQDIAGANLDPALRRALASSPEQQRLIEVYRRKGMTALAAELKKAAN